MPFLPFTDLVERSSATTAPSANRLQSLYSFTTAQKVSNRAGYDANIRWWIAGVTDAMREGVLSGAGGDRLVLDVDERVGSKLEWSKAVDGGRVMGRPKGIGGVLDSMSKPAPPAAVAVLLPLSTFLAQPTPIHQPPSLTNRLIARPLWWALGKVNPLASSEERVEDEAAIWKRVKKEGGAGLVHLELVEEAANNLIPHLEALSLPSSRLFTAATLQQSEYALVSQCLPSHLDRSPDKDVQEARLSLRDCKIVLKYLQRDKRIMVADSENEVYKGVDSPEEAVTATVTEADKGTVAIQATLAKLDAQIEEINKQIAGMTAKAGQYLKQGNKTVSLSYLRSRKQLEGVLEKRVASAEQLKSVIRGIDQAHGDVEVMAAYEASTATLRSVLAHPSLQLSHVDETVTSLSEAMADQAEIDYAIQSGGKEAVRAGGVAEVDEGDLEKELEELVLQEKEEQEQREAVKNAPVNAIPTQAVPTAAALRDVAPTADRPETHRDPGLKVQVPSRPASIAAPKSPNTERDQESIDEEARIRKQEEAARAVAERLKKEEKRLALASEE